MSTFLRLSWLISLVFCSFLTAPLTHAGSLNDVATANSHLKRAETNLQLVDGSVGHFTSPPKGSAGKLARMRLDQAFGDLEPAGKILGGLKGAGVAEATTRYNTALQLYNKLDGILTGAAPKPKPKEEEVPTPKESVKGEVPAPRTEVVKTVRLGYPHADNFKNTLFTLRRVETDTASLVSLLEQLRPVEDQLTINHRTTVNGMAKVTETRRQAGFVKDGLAKIPSNGEGVAEAYERLSNAHAMIDTAGAYLEPLNRQLLELVNMANYPDFDRDVRRLRELGQTYSNPAYLFRDERERGAEAFSQGDAAKAECVRIAQTYARLMEQETDQGKHIEATANNFLGQHKAFFEAAAEQTRSLPGEIRADLAEADRMATEAVESQKPMWFTGGIPQRLSWVDDKMGLYKVLDPAGAEGLATEVDWMKGSLRERADSLKELIIRENPLPNDAFEGADRDAAIAMAVDAWKIQEPDFELLTVRIPSTSWSRDTRWTYSNGTWYFVDKSTLQVRLIVADKDNPELAIDRPINVRKDHQSGDSLIGVPMRSFDEELQPSEYLLRSRVK